MRVTTPLVALVAAMWASAVWASAAQADKPAPESTIEASRQAWAEGRALYLAGKYGEALEEFETGYRLSGKGGFLFNMAECRRMLDDRADAKALYEQYLRENPQGRHREQAGTRCGALELGACTQQAPETTAPVSSADLKPEVVAARSIGSPAGTDTETAMPARPTDHESRPFYKHWAFWTGVGAVVVASVVTATVLATQGGEQSGPSEPTVVVSESPR